MSFVQWEQKPKKKVERSLKVVTPPAQRGKKGKEEQHGKAGINGGNEKDVLHCKKPNLPQKKLCKLWKKMGLGGSWKEKVKGPGAVCHSGKKVEGHFARMGHAQGSAVPPKLERLTRIKGEKRTKGIE